MGWSSPTRFGCCYVTRKFFETGHKTKVITQTPMTSTQQLFSLDAAAAYRSETKLKSLCKHQIRLNINTKCYWLNAATRIGGTRTCTHTHTCTRTHARTHAHEPTRTHTHARTFPCLSTPQPGGIGCPFLSASRTWQNKQWLVALVLTCCHDLTFLPLVVLFLP